MGNTLKPPEFEPTGLETAPGQIVPTPEYLEQNWETLIKEAKPKISIFTHETLRNAIIQTLAARHFKFEPRDKKNAKTMAHIDQKIWESVKPRAEYVIKKLYNAWKNEEEFKGMSQVAMAEAMAKKEGGNQRRPKKENILPYFRNYSPIPNTGITFILNEFKRLAGEETGTEARRHATTTPPPEDPGTVTRQILLSILNRISPRSEAPAALAPSKPPAALTQAEAPEPIGSTTDQPATSVADILKRDNLVTQPRGARPTTIIPPSAAPIARPIAPAAPKVPTLSGATTQRLPAARHWENRLARWVGRAWDKIASKLPSAKTMKKAGKQIGVAAAFIAGTGLAVYSDSGSQATQPNSETTPQNSSASTPGKPEASNATATIAAASTASPNTTAATSAEAKAVDAGTQAAPQNSAPAAQANAPEQTPTPQTANAQTPKFTIQLDRGQNGELKNLFETELKNTPALVRDLEAIALQTAVASDDQVQLYKAFLEKGCQQNASGITGQYFKHLSKVLNAVLKEKPNASAADLKTAFEHDYNAKKAFAAMKTKPTLGENQQFDFGITQNADGTISAASSNPSITYRQLNFIKGLSIGKYIIAAAKTFASTPLKSADKNAAALSLIAEIEKEVKANSTNPKETAGVLRACSAWKKMVESRSDGIHATPIGELISNIALLPKKTAYYNSTSPNGDFGNSAQPGKHTSLDQNFLDQLQPDSQIEGERRASVNTIQSTSSADALAVLDRLADERDAKHASLSYRNAGAAQETLAALYQMAANRDAADAAAQEAAVKTADYAAKQAEYQAKIDALTNYVLSKPTAVEKATTPQTAPSVKDELAQIDSGWDTIAQNHELAAIDKGWNIGNESSAATPATTQELSQDEQLAEIDAGWNKKAA